MPPTKICPAWPTSVCDRPCCSTLSSRAVARLSTSRTGAVGRDRPRLRPRERPRGSGLVDASAPRAVAPVCRFRRRTADRAARRPARAAEGGREAGMGRRGVLRTDGVQSARGAERALAPHVGTTSGRDRRRLAAVRELWLERDRLAHRRDLAPGRVLPDAAIVEAALAMPASPAELATLPVFRGRAQRREAERWARAIDRARRALRPRPAHPDRAIRRPTASQVLAVEGSRGGRPAGCGQSRSRDRGRDAWTPGRKPADPGDVTTGSMVAARPADS